MYTLYLLALSGFAGYLIWTERPLSELVAPLRRYFASGEISEDAGSRERMTEIMETIAAEHEGADEVSWMDGLLVRYADWWFNLRPSNTEPVLRLNLEADTEARMVETRDALLARIEAG